MKTFCIQTLGCKVNQYESDQIAQLLRSRGLMQVESADADLSVVNTCSVTIQAASKSRQAARRSSGHRTIVTGCWATSNQAEASGIPGVDAVLTHHGDVSKELHALLNRWLEPVTLIEPPPGQLLNDGWINSAGTSAQLSMDNTVVPGGPVKQKPAGTHALPLLSEHQIGRQRAFLKIQDGCDAHCTYCIIPQLRPALWSKSIDDAVDEATRLVASGHKEVVLTGIFLGAFRQQTALRRRQDKTGELEQLVEALCTKVPDLRRLRFSSLEPGDLSTNLIRTLASFKQVVPHFHLPLQSGSDAILHRMNRQYSRDDYLRMIDDVRDAFDRPAITTDIIVGFPGEAESEFERTLEVVDRVKFIHTHAFHFSPRPGTAAARWQRDFVRGPVVNERIGILNERTNQHGLEFRRSFLGEQVEVLVEHDISSPAPVAATPASPIVYPTEWATRASQLQEIALRHGRCERYFDVHFESLDAKPGDAVKLRIDRVTPTRTFGTPIA